MRSIYPHDLLARGRIRRNGAPHEPLAQTAKVDPQIAEISVNRHHSSLSARRRFGRLMRLLIDVNANFVLVVFHR